MKILLDSHAFVWWDTGSHEIGPGGRDAIRDPDNQIFVSSASIWEIAIKRRVGKIHFDRSLPGAVKANGFLELPISGADAEAAGDLDWAHEDPFDRLLAAQAARHGLTLATADSALLRLPGISVLRLR